MMMAMGAGLAQSYWLTQGMARVLGVNLTEAVIEGWLSRDEMGVMVTRCQMCGRHAECMGWLAQSAGAADALPEYCANKVELESLREG